ncbi:Phytochrome-like protein cph2 [Aquicella siphonis]|uniref:Phytochrome-like protein cph2 n=1 Tax=Aquicella siphonis TaxID=254247 RepID=A0A5E4PKM8_9COXI|nr:EAL domain-containing protein [Aquicella siphonis]VVC76967.1 Phytochrome-like protein cph2 [Aquicella siphonis]
MNKNILTLSLVCILAFVAASLFITVDPFNLRISTQTKVYLYFISSSVFMLFLIILLRQAKKTGHKLSRFSFQKKEIETRLHEEQRRFQAVFEYGNTCIAMLSIEGRFLRVNKAFCDLLGYEQDDVHAMNFYYLVNQNELNNLQINMQHLMDDTLSVYQGELECYKKNGETVWIKATLALIRDYDENPKYYILQAENITQQKNSEDRLRHMAYHDPLTSLANRNKLEQYINHLLATASRQQHCFALLFLDLDGFKNINDTIGHEAGDTLLQVIAERLRNTVRNTDMVARLGGDEFVVLVTDVKITDSVAMIAKKILDSILQGIIIKGQDIYITTSIGISIYPYDGLSLPSLMKCADLALYRAKEHGRNNYQFYTQEMTTKAKEKMDIKSALNQALAKQEFYLLFQPEMNIQTGQITSVEALLRWKNEQYSGIRPDEIIALAEESGLIIPVSEWILKSACEQLKKWHDQGCRALSMAVNCTARQFKQTTFIENIYSIINEIKIPPESLEIEVTESMIMKDPDNTLRILDSLKSKGVKIVIDDFGTGYWSIGNLRKLSVDKIKIDRTFIQHIMNDKTTAEITSAIIAMVNKLGMTSVAEGVETRQQYEFLLREKCCEIQGFYLSRPVSAEEISKLLQYGVSIEERETAADSEARTTS